MRKGKQPKIKREPEPKKQPKALPQVRGGLLTWRFSDADKAGPFAWSNLAVPTVYKNVMETLHNFETMTESEIRAAGCHPVEFGKLSKAAQNRLREIQLDDIDELMSFRLTGVHRIWCRMDRSIMYVFWWDPDHQVCPSSKKRT